MSCHSFLHSAQREHAGKTHCRQPWKAQVKDIGCPRLETRASSAYQCYVEISYGGQKCSVIRSFVVKPSLQHPTPANQAFGHSLAPFGAPLHHALGSCRMRLLATSATSLIMPILFFFTLYFSRMCVCFLSYRICETVGTKNFSGCAGLISVVVWWCAKDTSDMQVDVMGNNC